MDFYECNVIKMLDKTTNSIRFENHGYNIRRKETNKEFIRYDCLLTNSDKLRLEKSNLFKIVKENKTAFNGDIYTIYCDGAVYNYGNEEEQTVKLSALTTIVYKNDNEIFRTTKVYEQFLDNNTVEILALLIGLRYLNEKENKIALKRSKIIVSSDSQNLQEYIIQPKVIKLVAKKCTVNANSLYYSELMRELLNELNYYLIFLDLYSGWVKGHTQIKMNSSLATILNNTCDRLCKKAIKEKIHELKLDTYKEIKLENKRYKKEIKNKYKGKGENNDRRKVECK